MEQNYDKNDSENASFVAMTTTHQIMPPEAHYSTQFPLINPVLHVNTYSNNMDIMYTGGMHESHITATPVVKSHNPIPIYNPTSHATFSPLERVPNLSNMDIDEYFPPLPPTMDMFTNPMQHVYSPSSTSVTTNNSSVMFMDNCISPSSPINLMSPLNQQQAIPDYPMDPFAHPDYQRTMLSDHMMDHQQMYSEVPIVPTDIGMYMPPYNHDNLAHHYVERRRPLPRRHTVSTPYDNNVVEVAAAAANTPDVPQAAPTKSRKSSLKSKRHRSLGKLEMSSAPELSEKLETWSHQQLLERIQQLEKEKQVVVQNSLNKQVTPDESGVATTRLPSNKVRSASHTDTEDDDEEDVGPHVCQWDTCILEFNTLNDLILHVKTDHIGSGKANYYCCWKDCARKQKPFTKRHKMHNHLRTHTGERPFVCEEPDCGKRFSRLDSLTTHAKIHSNIRPYLCNFGDCGKAYYHLRSLRKHERSHKSTPPPPLPITSYGQENQMFTDWGLSAQAAVLNVMNREYA